jgi:hypothetical protein
MGEGQYGDRKEVLNTEEGLDNKETLDSEVYTP